MKRPKLSSLAVLLLVGLLTPCDEAFLTPLNPHRPAAPVTGPKIASSTELHVSLSLSGIFRRRNKKEKRRIKDGTIAAPSTTPTSITTEVPSRRQAIRKRIRKIVRKSAALIFAATVTLAPFNQPAVASRRSPASISRLLTAEAEDWLDMEQVSTMRKTSRSPGQPIETLSLWFQDDILGEIPPVRIPPKKKQHPYHNPRKIDIFAEVEEGDVAEEESVANEKDVAVVAEVEDGSTDVEADGGAKSDGTVVAAPKTSRTLLSKPGKTIIIAAGVAAGGYMGARFLLQQEPVEDAVDEKLQLRLQKEEEYVQRLLREGEAVNGVNTTKAEFTNGERSEERNPNSASSVSRSPERNQDLKRNLEIIEIARNMRNRKNQQDDIEETIQAQLEAENSELEAKRNKAMDALERIDARRIQNAEDKARKAQELAEGIERIQRLRNERKIAKEREQARKQSADRIAQLTDELQRKEQVKLDKKLERARRKLMGERFYQESLVALEKKRIQREMALEEETQRQRQDQIAKYGTVTPEPPIRAPPVEALKEKTVQPQAFNVPFFATRKTQTTVPLVQPQVQPEKTTKVERTKPDSAPTRRATEKARAPDGSKGGDAITRQKAEGSARGLLEARLAMEAKAKAGVTKQEATKDRISKAGDDVATTEAKQQTEAASRDLLEARLAMQAKAGSVPQEKNEEAQSPTTNAEEDLEQKRKAEATARSLLEARLALDAMSQAKESKSSTTKEKKLSQEKKAEASSRDLSEARSAFEATSPAKELKSTTTDEEELGRKRKAEVASKDLLKVRLETEAKAKTTPTKETATASFKDSNRKEKQEAAVKAAASSEQKLKAEAATRALLETRLSNKANARARHPTDASSEATNADALESKRKAEILARTLLEARFSFDAKEKAKRINSSEPNLQSVVEAVSKAAEKTSTLESDTTPSGKDEAASALQSTIAKLSVELKKRDELTARGLLERRLNTASRTGSTATPDYQREVSWSQRSARGLLEARLAMKTSALSAKAEPSKPECSLEEQRSNGEKNGKQTPREEPPKESLQDQHRAWTYRNGFW